MSDHVDYKLEFIESLIEQLKTDSKPYSAKELEKLFSGQRKKELLEKRLESKGVLGRLKERILFNSKYNKYEDFWKLPTQVRNDILSIVESNIKIYNPRYLGGIDNISENSFGERFYVEYITQGKNSITPEGILDFCHTVIYFKPKIDLDLTD